MQLVIFLFSTFGIVFCEFWCFFDWFRKVPFKWWLWWTHLTNKQTQHWTYLTNQKLKREHFPCKVRWTNATFEIGLTNWQLVRWVGWTYFVQTKLEIRSYCSQLYTESRTGLNLLKRNTKCLILTTKRLKLPKTWTKCLLPVPSHTCLVSLPEFLIVLILLLGFWTSVRYFCRVFWLHTVHILQYKLQCFKNKNYRILQCFT